MTIPLHVHGISSSPILGSSYALLLRDNDSQRFLPIIVGMAEAQAIQVQMMGIVPPRPMTHDLLATIVKASGMLVKQVLIHDFKDGVYYAELTLADESREIKLDCRASDAVALALRTDAPILTTPQVLDKNAFNIEDKDKPTVQRSENELTVTELNEAIKRAVADERYEDAARFQKIIKQKTQKQP